ncbi:MAG TPA: 3-oxoadipate enol-lactonase [Candidatus Acidoferrum sp.]|jgi:3-oxoadipate enol-lactonase
MPFADLPNVRIHYALSGNPLHPALVLSNSLGTNFSMWDAQTAAFEKQFHLLRYDMRGHGQSSVPAPPYSVPELAADVLALADSLNISRFHFCGLSIGGMIGMSLALNSPHRLQKLILCSTAAKIGTQESWNTRIATVRAQGMQEIARATGPRWFTPSFLTNSPDAVAAILRGVETLNPDGYIGGCCAVRDFDARNQISNIRVPTLILSASHDPGAPPADGHFLADHIPGARYAELNASHISSIEDPSHLTSEVLSFLTQ